MCSIVLVFGAFALNVKKNEMAGYNGNMPCDIAGLGILARLGFGNIICNSSSSTPAVVLNPLPTSTTLFLSQSGQSNSIGSGASPAINTTSLYAQNFYWNNTALVALTETSTETQSSGLGNSLSFWRSLQASIADRWGVGATAIALLRPGTTNYNNAIAEQLEAMNAFGAGVCAGPLTFIHGETDAAQGATTTYYLDQLLNMQSGWYASSTASVGANRMCRSTEQPLFYSQIGQWMNSGEGGYSTAPDVVMAQYQGAVQYPSRLKLVYPAYIIPFQSDNEHYTNLGQELSGEYFAKALSTFISDTDWTPLLPSSISCTNNVITLNTTGGVGSTCLTTDTTTLAMKPHLGFTYRGAATSTPSAQVTDATVTGCNTVQITLDQSCETGGNLQYGWSAIPYSANPGRTSTAAFTPGGNIRNQDTSWVHSRLGYALPDWLIAFERAIDTCTNCSPLPTYTFSNLYGITTDNSPSAFLSCGHVNALNGASQFTIAGNFRAITNGDSWANGTTAVLFAQNSINQRNIDVRAIPANRMQVYFPISNNDTTALWTSATGTFMGEAEEGFVISYNGLGATNADKFHAYRCAFATCTDITSVGAFAGTFPAALTTSTRADFAIGASSAGGTGSTGIERRVSQLAIWNTFAMSPAGVEEWWNGGRLIDPRTHASGTPSNYWPLQPDSGFRDVVGVNNCRPYGSNTGIVPLWTPRYILTLPEAGEYVTAPGTGSSTANTAVTYDAWMRCSSAPTVGRNAFGRIGGGELRNSSTSSQQYRPVFFTGTNSTTQRCFATADRFPSGAGTYRRMTVTFDEGRDPGAASTTEQRNQAMTDLYIDGVLTDFEACDTVNLMSIPDDDSVGNYMFNESGDGTDGMACQYSNLAMYNTRLTQSEISAISYSTNRNTLSSSSTLRAWIGPFPGDNPSTWRNAASGALNALVTGIFNSSTDMITWTGP